jgi:tetratricopeptide (TPR) repeat protein
MKKIEELTIEMDQRRREEEEFSDRIEELLNQFKDFPEEEGNGYQEGFTVIANAADYGDTEPELTLENERDLNDYLAQFEAGRAYEKKGLWNKAIEAYRRAIDVKPDFVDAIEHLAFLLEKLNREKEASPLWEKVISLKK